jgi:acylphosphatase
MKFYRFISKGNVQGVGYRAFVVTFFQNDFSHVCGYVQNLANGDVETVVKINENERDSIRELLKVGPSYSNVTEVLEEEIKVITLPLPFKIKR